MGFWDRLFTGLRGQSGQSEQTSQSDDAPETGPRSGGFWGFVFGGGNREETPTIDTSDIDRSEIEDSLEQYAPEDRSQGLFYLGWVDPNVSQDIRVLARRRWEQEYGEWNPRKGRRTMSEENWAKWRQYMGYGRS